MRTFGFLAVVAGLFCAGYVVRARNQPLFEAVCAIRAHDGVPVLVRPGAVPPGFAVEVADPDAPAPYKSVQIRWSPPARGGPLPQTHTIELVATVGSVEHRVAVEVRCSNPEVP